jgi:hypothetical protein
MPKKRDRNERKVLLLNPAHIAVVTSDGNGKCEITLSTGKTIRVRDEDGKMFDKITQVQIAGGWVSSG